MQQVTMRSMDFDHFETSFVRAQRRIGESLHTLCNARDAQRCRCPECAIERNRRRADGFPAAFCSGNAAVLVRPWAVGAGLAAGMRQLYASARSLCFNEAGNAA